MSRAVALEAAGSPDAKNAAELSDMFGRLSQRTVNRLFRDLWHNDDAMQYKIGVKVMEGEHRWIESGVIGVENLLARDLKRLATDAAPAQSAETARVV